MVLDLFKLIPWKLQGLLGVLYTAEIGLKKTPRKKMPYYYEKIISLAHFNKFTYTILRMRNFTVVASFIIWIFKNHVLIKADIEHMRESTHIFMTSDKKNITVPYGKIKVEKTKLFAVVEIKSMLILVLIKYVLATQREERQSEAKGISPYDCGYATARKRLLYIFFFIFPTFLNHFRCPHQCLDVY
jgi:hypothetical protein